MAVTGWLAATDEKSPMEGTINLHLPEGGEAIPIPFDETFNWGSLLAVAATLSDFPEHRLSLCVESTEGRFMELRLHSNDIVGSHIENDQDLRVLVDYHEKYYSGQHEDPPGVKVDSRPASPKPVSNSYRSYNTHSYADPCFGNIHADPKPCHGFVVPGQGRSVRRRRTIGSTKGE